jgi:hypothetical protein
MLTSSESSALERYAWKPCKSASARQVHNASLREAHPEVITRLHPFRIIVILVARVHMTPIRPSPPVLLISYIQVLDNE